LLEIQDSTGAVKISVGSTGTLTMQNNPTFFGNGGTGSASATLQVTGGSSDQKANLQFRPTFGSFPADTGPRRAADIWGGFTSTWGTEYLAFGVGNGGDANNLTTERMRIDGAGRITMNAQPAFNVGRNAGDVLGSNVDIVWNFVTTNIGSCYNSSTGVFTAPVAGRYFFSASGMKANTYAVLWLELLKNGVRVGSVNPYTEGGQYAHVGFSAVVEMAANDTVKVRTGGNTSAGLYAQGNAHNYFSGYLLG
jgi:hypothetical protein